MSLKLNGATSGSIELDVPDDIGSDLNITIPGAAGTLDRLERAGNILQVQSAVLSTQTDLSSSSGWTDTGLSLSITPTYASNKIILYASVNYEMGSTSATSAWAGFRILRDSTVIYLPQTGSNGGLGFGVAAGSATSMYLRNMWNYHLLDSPSTTSSITYKIQADKYYTSTDTFLVNGQVVTTDVSRLLAVEVAA